MALLQLMQYISSEFHFQPIMDLMTVNTKMTSVYGVDKEKWSDCFYWVPSKVAKSLLNKAEEIGHKGD